MSGKDEFLAKLLLEAIEEEQFEISKVLLVNLNASPNILVEGRGIAAIHYASGMENVEFGEKIIEIMLEYNGDPNVKTEDNITPMHVATIWGRVNIVKMLLNKGGDVDCVDNENKTPLLYAIYECQFEIFEIFQNYYFEKKIHEKNKKLGSAISAETQSKGQEKIDKRELKFAQVAGKCNYNDASPYYINLKQKRKQSVQVNQQHETVNNNDANSCEEKNLFELTEDNLIEYSNNVSPDRSKASFIKQWREKVQRSKTRSSLINKFNDIDSLLSGIMTEESIDFTNTMFSANGEEEMEKKRPAKFDMTGFGKLLQNLRKAARAEEEELTFQTAMNESNFIKSPNKFGEVAQIAEEYVHQDPENGLIFYEKKLLAATETDTATNKSSDNETDFSIPVDYDTDALRAELTNFGDVPGPITKSTKRLYTKRLIKYKRNIEDMKVKEIPESNFSVELRRTIRSKDFFLKIPKFLELETKMCNYFQDTNMLKTKLREGNLKTSFIYLLIDPRISMNLPGESMFLDKHEVWKRFLQSIFYVGKGKSSRPYSHLYEAIKEFNWRNEKKIRLQLIFPEVMKVSQPFNKVPFPVKSPIKQSNINKTKRILEIWEHERGVVCLHIFHNIMPAEAYTREASMIEALTLQHLTNLKTGDYYGCVKSWSMREKKNMGIILLYKALQIFLIEGESQLLPSDIVSDT